MKDNSRRDILRRIAKGSAVAGVGILGPTQSAVAKNREEQKAATEELLKKYRRRGAAQQAFEENARDVLNILEENRYLETADVSELSAFKQPGEFSEMENTQIATITGSEDKLGTKPGEITALLGISESQEDISINIFVLPEAGHSYATIEENGEMQIIGTASEDDIEPADRTYKRCTDDVCEIFGDYCPCHHYQHEVVSCIDDQCGVIDTGCDSSCCGGICDYCC